MTISIGGQNTGAALNLPDKSGTAFQYTLNANAAIRLPMLNGSNGRFTLALTQDGVGGRVPTFSTGGKRTLAWVDGTPSAANIDTAAGVTTVFDFVYYESVIEGRIINATTEAGGSDVVSVKEYGAVGDGVTNDTAAINLAVAALEVGDTLYFPPGDYAVNSTIEVAKERVTISMDGYLIPFDTFTDYLLHVTKETPAIIVDYQSGINFHRLRIDGQFKSRGLKMTYVDMGSWHDVLILRTKGTGVKMEGCRESAFHGLRIISGLEGAAVYSNPSNWSSGTSYVVGNRVRYKNNIGAWSSGGTYNLNFMAEGSDGRAYRSITTGNINNDPTTDNVNWVWEPWRDYECLIDHSNKDPTTNNSNDDTSADRYWKLVYQYEVALDLNQEVVTNDGTNAIEFYGLKIRNCDHRELVRIDNNANNGTVRLLIFNGSHIHYLEDNYPSSDASEGQNSGATVKEYGTLVNIQRARWVYFNNCELRMGGSSDRCMGVRQSGEHPGKFADLGNFTGCNISGESDGQIGIYTGQYVNQRNSTHYVANEFTMTGSGARRNVGDYSDLPENNVRMMVGAGTPESAVTAPIGAMFTRTDGASGLVVYAKASGSSATGWVPMLLGTANTAGAVPFVSSGNVITQDSANLFFDATNRLLGVGTAAPASRFHGYLNTDTVTTPVFTAEQDDSGDCTFQWLLSATRAWVAGIDNSDGDAWKLWNANDGFSAYFLRVGVDGKVSFDTTITAGGTTAAQTINKASGRVNAAAAATSVTVNNSLVTAGSLVFATIATNDATATVKNVVSGDGSFVITLGAAATGETAINFWVIN